MKKSNLAFVILGLGPAFLFYAFLFVYPSISAFRISLFDWSGFTPDMQFIGLANFIELFQDRHFWTVVMRNSFFIILFAGIGVFGLSLLFSNALTSKIKGKRFLRSAIFFPNVVNPIALAVLWSFIYNRQWGLLNSIIGVFGFEAQTWTSTDRLFWALLVALIWIYVGFFTVILVAALDRIPFDMIEAALVEGATKWQIFVKIKLPLIWDVFTTAVILWGIMAVKEFSFLYSWGGGFGMPQEGQQNLAVYMYVTAFGRRVSVYRMGYATAMGVIMLFMVIFIVFVARKVMRRDSVQY